MKSEYKRLQLYRYFRIKKDLDVKTVLGGLLSRMSSESIFVHSDSRWSVVDEENLSRICHLECKGQRRCHLFFSPFCLSFFPFRRLDIQFPPRVDHISLSLMSFFDRCSWMFRKECETFVFSFFPRLFLSPDIISRWSFRSFSFNYVLAFIVHSPETTDVLLVGIIGLWRCCNEK